MRGRHPTKASSTGGNSACERLVRVGSNPVRVSEPAQLLVGLTQARRFEAHREKGKFSFQECAQFCAPPALGLVALRGKARSVKWPLLAREFNNIGNRSIPS